MKYTINIKNYKNDQLFRIIKNNVNTYGFCVLENVIPKNEINFLKKEIKNSKKKIDKNIQKIVDLKKKYSPNIIFKKKLAEVRLQRDKSRPPKCLNDLVWMPKYSKMISQSIILDILKNLLDDHIRLSQIHPKIIKKSKLNKNIFINDLYGLPRLISGTKNTRDWHADWPHDTWAYGNENANENIGCIKKPFPNVLMSLTVIWFFTDITKNAGTFVIPKSHKMKKDPRSSNFDLYKPYKKEFQIKAKAGSVLIQDSRLWHSAPIHSHGSRIAMVNRWSPWWLSINDYAYGSMTNVVCRPMSYKEYCKMPEKLKPFIKHLCADVIENIQTPLLKRSLKSSQQAIKWININS